MLNKEKYKIGYTVTYRQKIDMGRTIDYIDNEYREFMEKHLGETTTEILCTIKEYQKDNLVLESVWGVEYITPAENVSLSLECEREYNINNLLK